MINVDTIYFLELIQDLAKQSKKGIRPLSELTDDIKYPGKCIWYDDANPYEEPKDRWGIYPLFSHFELVDGKKTRVFADTWEGLKAYVEANSQDEDDRTLFITDLETGLRVYIREGRWHIDDFS